jgi:predicted RNA methylase
VGRTGRRLAVLGCGQGDLCITLAALFPDDVVAGFDPDASAVAIARRRAARCGVADRATFEVACAGALPGSGYDLVILQSPGLP